MQREDRKVEKIKRGAGTEGLETRNTLYPGKRMNHTADGISTTECDGRSNL